MRRLFLVYVLQRPDDWNWDVIEHLPSLDGWEPAEVALLRRTSGYHAAFLSLGKPSSSVDLGDLPQPIEGSRFFTAYEGEERPTPIFDEYREIGYHWP